MNQFDPIPSDISDLLENRNGQERRAAERRSMNDDQLPDNSERRNADRRVSDRRSVDQQFSPEEKQDEMSSCPKCGKEIHIIGGLKNVRCPGCNQLLG